MPTDSDLIQLYSGRILALAADIPLTERLSADCQTVKKRSPLCGSTVTVDVISENGVITAYGQDVKACALGQASASVLAANVIGRSVAEIRTGRDQLMAMLKNNAPAPKAPFAGLEILIPAKEFKNRHASIMLAFEATLEALQ